MNLLELYKKRMRYWQRYMYEKTGNGIYVWLSLAFDILLIIFIIYFISTVESNLSLCFNELERYANPEKVEGVMKFTLNMTREQFESIEVTKLVK